MICDRVEFIPIGLIYVAYLHRDVARWDIRDKQANSKSIGLAFTGETHLQKNKPTYRCTEMKFPNDPHTSGEERLSRSLRGLCDEEHVLVEHKIRRFDKLDYVRVFHHLQNRARVEKWPGGKIRPHLTIFAKEEY